MLRELSGSSHLDDLDRRYSAMLPFTIKEVNTVRLHKAIDMPGLTFYEPLDADGSDGEKDNLILLTKQYHDVCPFDLNVYVFCRDDEEQRNKVKNIVSSP